MNKKIVFALGTALALVGGVAAMSAFEAHVINVTAHVENALSVDTYKIDFGTVFPQEKLLKNLNISMSQSFLEQTRIVSGVRYNIKQKPKVRANDANPNGDPWATIHPAAFPNGIIAHEYCLNNIPQNLGNPQDEYYTFCYPNLAPYISKKKAADDSTLATDRCTVPAAPWHWADCGVNAPNLNWLNNHAWGQLRESNGDLSDHWIIDLVVPCFEGQCDQTYTTAEYGPILPAEFEGQTFGADLWIEVLGLGH